MMAKSVICRNCGKRETKSTTGLCSYCGGRGASVYNGSWAPQPRQHDFVLPDHCAKLARGGLDPRLKTVSIWADGSGLPVMIAPDGRAVVKVVPDLEKGLVAIPLGRRWDDDESRQRARLRRGRG